MRAAVRLLSVFALLVAFASISQSDTAPAGVNYLAFNKGSPTPKSGGVDVAVTQRPTVGYTCTKITIRVIDNDSGATLDSHVVNNPGATVTKSFTQLGNNRVVQVTVDATFQNGAMFDFLSIQAVVTTQ